MRQPRRIVKAKQQPPHELSPFDSRVVYALKNLSRGQASADEQTRALAWIVNIACGLYDNTYFSESVRDSDFACGKRFVGHQIVGLINMDPDLLTDKPPST